MNDTMELICTFAVVNRQGGVIEDFSWGSITATSRNTNLNLSDEPFIILRTATNGFALGIEGSRIICNLIGIKYNLIGNIGDLFTRFLNEGRATVCLKEPSHNIIITNAMPDELTTFIVYLKKLLPADSPVHASMAAFEQPIPQIYFDCQEKYELRMKNIIGMNSNLDQCTELKICNCTLELAGDQVPIADAIMKMKNLTTLRLEKNELCSSTFLEIESKELKQLHLHQCETPLPTASLFKNDLWYKDSLVELDLEGNQWSEVPNGIFQFRNLLKLLLSRNCFTELPDMFGNLPKLEKLELFDNRLTRIPPSIFALQNLPKLPLNNNCITELPDMFDNLLKLEELEISCNRLTHLPPSIFQCQNLLSLSLSDNYITELPDKFTNLSKLKHLSLSNNQFQYLPPSIFALHLRELDIEDNEFNLEIPPSVGSELIVHSLKELSYRAILNHKLKVEEGMLPNEFLKDLANYHQCVCGCKFVDEGQDLSFSISLKDISRIIYCKRYGIRRVPVKGKMCTSLKSCFLDRFTKRK